MTEIRTAIEEGRYKEYKKEKLGKVLNLHELAKSPC